MATTKKGARGSRLLNASCVLLAFAMQAACAQTAGTGPGSPIATPASNGSDPQQRFWYDGERRRELRVDPAWVADFRGTKPNLQRRSEAAAPAAGEKKAAGLSTGQSEVLRDESGAPRALPGGVIVRLHERDVGEAAKLFAELGLAPVRALDPQQRTWLVESPAGLESLALANRLHETGRFEMAAPNWWRPRSLK